MYSYGPFHLDKQRQNDQLEPIYSSSVPIWDVALKTCREQWMIEKGSEKESGISVLMVQHHDDDIVSTKICHGQIFSKKIMWNLAAKLGRLQAILPQDTLESVYKCKKILIFENEKLYWEWTPTTQKKNPKKPKELKHSEIQELLDLF